MLFRFSPWSICSSKTTTASGFFKECILTILGYCMQQVKQSKSPTGRQKPITVVLRVQCPCREIENTWGITDRRAVHLLNITKNLYSQRWKYIMIRKVSTAQLNDSKGVPEQKKERTIIFITATS